MKLMWIIFVTVILSVVSVGAQEQEARPSEVLHRKIIPGLRLNQYRTNFFANPDPEYRAMLAELCEHVLEYTRTHTGDDLDGYWREVFEAVFEMKARFGCVRFDEVDATIREAWEVLDQTKPKKPESSLEAAMSLAVSATWPWIRKDTKQATALMDDAIVRYYNRLDMHTRTESYQREYITGPYLLLVSVLLPPQDQKDYFKKRYDAMLHMTSDDSYEFAFRSDTLCRWAITLYNIGDADSAGALLDGWLKESGEEALTTHYCYARFFAAIYGAGGWQVANRMVSIASNMLAMPDKVYGKEYLYLMMKGYYANITHSDYELMRRASIFRAQARARVRAELEQVGAP